jgi:hypothetical protein
MIKRIIIIVLVVLSLILIPTVSVNGATPIRISDISGDGVWVGNIWNVEMYPMETKYANILLYNSLNENTTVNASINPETHNNGSVVFSLNKTLFNMAPNSYTTVLLTVTANGNTKPDIYSSIFSFSYYIPDPYYPPSTPTLSATPEIINGEWTPTEEGTTPETIIINSNDNNGTVTIEEDTLAMDNDGNVINDVSCSFVGNYSEQPSNVLVVYDMQPSGAMFSKPITITLSYNPDNLPKGIIEDEVVIAYYDEELKIWVQLENIVVDKVNHTVSGTVTHFTTFAVLFKTDEQVTETPIQTNTTTGTTATSVATITTSNTIEPTQPSVVSTTESTTEKSNDNEKSNLIWWVLGIVVCIILVVVIIIYKGKK